MQILRGNTAMPEEKLTPEGEWVKGVFVFEGWVGPPKGSWYATGGVGMGQMLGHLVGGFVGWWRTRDN